MLSFFSDHYVPKIFCTDQWNIPEKTVVNKEQTILRLREIVNYIFYIPTIKQEVPKYPKKCYSFKLKKPIFYRYLYMWVKYCKNIKI